jgi:hypothetical protein
MSANLVPILYSTLKTSSMEIAESSSRIQDTSGYATSFPLSVAAQTKEKMIEGI